MAKVADKYFKVDPWMIVEEGFEAEYSQVAESVFSLGNEYMGVRGYFEEGYSGKTLKGSYFNGVYASERLNDSAYKGIINETEFMVNAVNWLAVKIQVDDEKLDVESVKIQDFYRVLDMRSGLLTRSFLWETKNGKRVRVVFERFLSMERPNQAAQRICVTPLNFDGTVEVSVELDFGELHRAYRKNYWQVAGMKSEADFMEIEATTIGTEKYLYSGCKIICDGKFTVQDYKEAKKLGKRFLLDGTAGRTTTVTRIVWNDKESGTDARSMLSEQTYEGMLEETTAWWRDVWKKSDIVIDGDDENQQGIRYCIFQMLQTYHGAQPGNNIGAKGLTGEAYNGNAFWDTETYCLPFFIFNNSVAAKNLLLFRYRTLGEAKKRAKELDCEGAFYPIATISGKECCNLWQHASLQLQASTGVAYGVWMYEKLTGDETFMQTYGAEILVEISRMLASRGDWSADTKRYGYYCVMGPDEFQMMVHNNCYTNIMGKFTFIYTRRVLERLRQNDKDSYEELVRKCCLTEQEMKDWENKADNMYIPKKQELYEQHEGFFSLPHVDVDAIPREDFPLYHHWSYDRIYRNDMIKQPDVLMFMLMFNRSFSEKELQVNYDYYEPKCIHESSLSPSVHSILAAQLKKKEEAYSFFRFATRMDLDNYNRNSEEGLHTTSIAAAWMNIVYGFGGMRSDGDMLEFAPTIPKDWTGYTFHITYRDAVITVDVRGRRVAVKADRGAENTGTLKVKVYGQIYDLQEQMCEIEIPEEWR